MTQSLSVVLPVELRSLNAILGRLFAAEASVLRRIDLPVGVSLLALCERSPEL